VTHHGLDVSNNPTRVHAIDPVVTVMCNGPEKGGGEKTLQTLAGVKSLQASYQLHRNVKLPESVQAKPSRIANTEPTVNCAGRWIKASVAPDGKSYTVQISEDGPKETFQTRGAK